MKTKQPRFKSRLNNAKIYSILKLLKKTRKNQHFKKLQRRHEAGDFLNIFL